MKFGQMVKEAREKKGISVRDLASRVQTSPGMISRVESTNDSHRRPSKDLARRLVSELDMPKWSLLYVYNTDLDEKSELVSVYSNLLVETTFLMDYEDTLWEMADEFIERVS